MAIAKKTTVLVTGSAGLIASHLVDRLCEPSTRLDGNPVEVIATYRSLDPLSYFAQSHLQKKVKRVVQCDLRDSLAVEDLIKTHKPSYIFHLAAEALVDECEKKPYEAFSSNIMATVNILDSARKAKNVEGVMVASSDKAYGMLSAGKKYHETDRLEGDHPYEVSKSAADLIAQSYYKTYGVPVVVARFGNVYGEGDTHFSRLIPGLMRSLVTKKTFAIRSDGTFIRDYLYVNDVVEGYILLAQNISQTAGEAYNFGSTDTLSVLDVVKIAESVLGIKVKYTVLDKAKHEIPYQSLDWRKVSKTVGWKPRHCMSDTLARIYDWYARVL